MSNDPLSFLSEAPASTSAPETPAAEAKVEAAPETPAAEPSGPARDEKGRFAAAKAEAEALPPANPLAGAAPASPPAPDPAAAPAYTPPTPEEWAALQKENAGLKSAVATNRAKAREARQPGPAPDYWTEDDRKYHDAEVTAIRQEAFDQLAQASFEFLAERIGEAQAKEVADWAGARAEADPAFNNKLIASRNPMKTAYEAFNADPAQRIKSLEAEVAALKGGGSPNPAPANPGATPPTPAPAAAPTPTTIVNAPSVGGMAHVPVGEGEAYRAAFSG